MVLEGPPPFHHPAQVTSHSLSRDAPSPQGQLLATSGRPSTIHLRRDISLSSICAGCCRDNGVSDSFASIEEPGGCDFPAISFGITACRRLPSALVQWRNFARTAVFIRKLFQESSILAQWRGDPPLLTTGLPFSHFNVKLTLGRPGFHITS